MSRTASTSSPLNDRVNNPSSWLPAASGSERKRSHHPFVSGFPMLQRERHVPQAGSRGEAAIFTPRSLGHAGPFPLAGVFYTSAYFCALAEYTLGYIPYFLILYPSTRSVTARSLAAFP